MDTSTGLTGPWQSHSCEKRLTYRRTPPDDDWRESGPFLPAPVGPARKGGIPEPGRIAARKS
jgi:hypothetical protein